MTNQEAFALHFTKALQALTHCPIAFVQTETMKGRELLSKARAQRVAALVKDGWTDARLAREGGAETLTASARRILGVEAIPFINDCQGARIGDIYANLLDDMRKPGDSFKTPIPKGMTHASFGDKLRHRAQMRGMRLSVVAKDMPKGILKVTCTDHAAHRQAQRQAVLTN